ncbi:PRD domain-containing protein [Streptomyces roseoverticillatus]|uniref:PRD domain-containing protein n=1 Tax=Streptomyces roseoverticillatus TaxID=66429 RepID=UPI001F23574B|nr:PRD domain-containing protein [Streptomyces roseoverticillatus]MCF3102171.1 PRD domain-containing protein [Streptomyces roseoverticillatus]
MDEGLGVRVRLFREGGHVPGEVVEFVVAELGLLAAAGRSVTEARAGMLTSHLMMALTRSVKGEPVEPGAMDEQVAAELADHPEAVAAARALAARARAALGCQLPESEIGFLGMHLAVLPRCAPS